MRNWINLFENAEPILEAKMFTSSPYAGHTEQAMFKNPTLSDLDQMVSTKDYRGVTDSKNVFIWDANRMIHHHGTWAIAAAGFWEGEALPKLKPDERVSPKFNPQRDIFYLYNPERPNESVDEWRADDEATRAELGIRTLRLSPHCAMSIPHSSSEHLQSIPAMARLMRHATAMVDSY
jgi:hypothetical protein